MAFDIPELGYGIVRGRFLAGMLDSDDDNLRPDAVPLKGYVTFRAATDVIRVTAATPDPAILFPQNLKVFLDEQGYLSHNGSRDIALLATNDPAGRPSDWTWRVGFTLQTLEGEGVSAPSFSFTLPAGTQVDLSSVEPVPADPGSAIPTWTAAVTATQTARDEAIMALASALGARDAAIAAAQAAQGLGILKVGDPIPANWPSKIVLREM